MHKGKIYVTKDYYGGIRLSTVNTDATNIDGSGSIFENIGRGSGDIELDDAAKLVRCWNAYEKGGSHTELLATLKNLVNLLCHPGSFVSAEDIKNAKDVIAAAEVKT